MNTETSKNPGGYHACRVPPQAVTFTIEASDIGPRLEGDADGPRAQRFAVIGQDRAMLAIRMALSIKDKGYNVFVSGPAGTGKRTAILQMINSMPPDLSRLRDIALCHNFMQEDSPSVLYFAPGRAREFRERLRRFIGSLGDSLRGLVRQEHVTKLRDRMLVEAEHTEQKLISEFEKRLGERGFQLVQVDEENDQKTDILPLVKGEVAAFEDLQEMVSKGEFAQEDYESLREQYFGLGDEMQDFFRNLQLGRQKTMEAIRDLRLQIIGPTIRHAIDSLKTDFPFPEVGAFLDDLAEDLVSTTGLIAHISLGSQGPHDRSGSDEEDDETPDLSAFDVSGRLASKFDINVLIDHGQSTSNPLIFEQYPDAIKLFGSVENPQEGMEPVAPHMLVRSGSFLKASGGYLILKAEDLLREEDVYIGLKRVLSEGALEIRAVNGPLGQQGPLVKPLPIKIDVKVIVMAPDGLYEVLYDKDEDFQKLFKVPADFDYMVDRSPGICRAYADFFHMIALESKVPLPDTGAETALLAYAARDAEFRNKLSTRFSVLADLVREAGYWAKEDGKSVIDRAAVEKALDTRRYLYSLPEEKLDEMIMTGEIIMELKGMAVGRVNGLAVMDRGYYSFGRPTVISAQVSPGSEGVINVEHEAGLSGEIHDKGAFIVGAFIQATYARDFPLSIKASIVFEQSYTEVDGDSASSAEVYALLSAISEVPLRQDLAVTGSVNQRGQIQPVGGVNEKIEGFFAICSKAGLTGSQGVIIPHQNLQNLVLDQTVQRAIEAKSFHIYAIKTIEEGLEILTGMDLGVRTPKGTWSKGSLHGMIEDRLREMAQTVKEFG